MRSNFLPNKPFINATVCCGNPDCNNTEAEAERSLLLDIIFPGCRSVCYCTVDCQETHSKNHKHECSLEAEYLKEGKEWLEHNHNKENTDNDDDDINDVDNESFQAILPKDDCPICTLPLPIDDIGSVYAQCCGNSMCNGCLYGNIRVTCEKGRPRIPPCPFCREPHPLTNDESIIRLEKRIKMNDSEAIFTASDHYRKGKCGLPKDLKKAFDLCLRAADLGHSGACHNAAIFYKDGVVVAKDMTKARNYCEMAVKKGHIEARHNLGVIEWSNGNHHLASRHKLISAAAGFADSLDAVAEYYQYQLVTKEEYSTALTLYSNVHKNEYSSERERAAAALR